MPDVAAPAWSDLHDLALVYLVLLYSASTHAPRGEASSAPLPEDARRRLAQLYPDVEEAYLHRAFREAFLMHVSVAGASMLEVAVVSLRRTLPRARRVAVLDDLAGLVAESGHAEGLHPADLSFIQYLAARWDLEPKRERRGP